MDSLGSITMLYPFLSSETRSTLDAIMKQADSYYDFVVRLTQEVTVKKPSPELAYIAAVNTWNTRDISLVSKINHEFGETPRIKAWTFLGKNPFEQEIQMNDIKSSINKALEKESSTWITAHLHLLQALSMRMHRPASEIFDTILPVQNLLEQESDLECFQSILNHIMGWAHRVQGEILSATLAFMKGLEAARNFNDKFTELWILCSLGITVINENPSAAFDFIERANRINQSLKIPYWKAVIMNYMSSYFEIIGNYDLALKCLSKFSDSYAPDGPELLVSKMARIYITLGEGKEAFEWIRATLDDKSGKYDTRMASLVAETYLTLGKLEEARLSIDLFHKYALKTGKEQMLADYYYIEGIYETEKGNISEAADQLESALDLYKNLGYLNSQTRTLLARTKLELLSTHYPEEENEFNFGPWMQKLGNHVRKYELVGVELHIALLKAKYLLKQNQAAMAKEILVSALNRSEDMRSNTLKIKIHALLTELE